MSSETMSKWPGWRLSAVAFVVSLGGSFNFGYQLVLTNPSQDAFVNFVNESLRARHGLDLSDTGLNGLWSVIVSLIFVGCLIGSLSVPVIIDNFGRKFGLFISTGTQMLGCVLSILSKKMNLLELYSCARLLFGMALGVALATSSIYLSEISPKRCRGFISMSTGILLQTGLVFASVIAMPMIFGSETRWDLLYWIELVPLVLLMISLPFIHESPSYLVAKKRSEEALAAIRRFHNCSEREATLELAEIHEIAQKNAGALSLVGVLRNPATRRATLVGCTVALGLGFTGIVVINAFALKILEQAGLSTFEAAMGNVGLGVVSVISSLTSTLVVDRSGRRPILLFLNSALILINLTIFALQRLYETSNLQWVGLTLVGVMALHILAFSMGPGPIAFFITSEMVGQNARSAAQSWTTIVQMGCRAIISAIYLPFWELLGAFAYLILFVGPLAVAAIILYFYLPETKNRNVEEVRQVISDLPKGVKLSRSDRAVSALAVDDDKATMNGISSDLNIPRVRRISRSLDDITAPDVHTSTCTSV